MAYKKDPNAVLDYTVDWTDWLGADQIASVEWILTTGLTKVSQIHTTTKATAFLSGGAAGSTEKATCRITTVGGRVDDRTIVLSIVER